MEHEKHGGVSVAVVGSGISGLASAWSLAREGYHVTMYEADEHRLGGHSFTYDSSPKVDLGFQVFNLTTYPYLTTMLHELQVDTEMSDMSFSVSLERKSLEWASHGLAGIFAQKKNALSPKFLGMIKDAFRFAKQALEVLDENSAEKWGKVTLGEYLNMRGYSDSFKKWYLIPMTAAVWSVPNETMDEYPIVPLVRFWNNHHLLNPIGRRPKWRVVKNRSETYVNAIAKDLQDRGATILLGSRVVFVDEDKVNNKVWVKDVQGRVLSFDHVVMASHSDQSYNTLGPNVDPTLRELVGKVRYQKNDVYLHEDEALMPNSKDAWASWNVLDSADGNSICVTYWLNRLQNLSPDSPMRFATLNPPIPPAPSKTLGRFEMDHPVFDDQAVKAQKKINELQAMEIANRRIWFAGAWLGWGFHEDGIRSAVAAVTGINKGKPPSWAVKAGVPKYPALEIIHGPSPETTAAQRLGIRLFDTVASRGITHGFLRIILPNGKELTFGRPCKEVARDVYNEPVATVFVHDFSMLARCIKNTDIGLGEAYMEHMFDTDNLIELLNLLILNQQNLLETLKSFSSITSVASGLFYRFGRMIELIRHRLRDNTVKGSRKNIEEHYDLGNDLYELFLDETMTYSAGIHLDVPPGSPPRPLKEAQLRKLDTIIQRAQIQPGDMVLEIGCGWGSFAIRAASTTGCRVRGVTISTEQLKLATERVKQAGLEDRIELIMCDYRQLPWGKGCFDRVVSIEMLEAVGHNHLEEYFQVVNDALKPNGRACIQVISIPNERYKHYMKSSDFIRRHIFPGGHLPCLDAIDWAIQNTSLELLETPDIGPDYAVSLRMWRERFDKEHDNIIDLGYSEKFFRKWIFYFAYCEAGFERRFIQDYHLVMRKDPALPDPARARIPDPVDKETPAELAATVAAKAAESSLVSTMSIVLIVFVGILSSLLSWMSPSQVAKMVLANSSADVVTNNITFGVDMNLSSFWLVLNWISVIALLVFGNLVFPAHSSKAQAGGVALLLYKVSWPLLVLLTVAATSKALESRIHKTRKGRNQQGVSALYNGTVFHRRKKLEDVSPSENFFRYKVFMAYIDLDEVEQGTAFHNVSKWLIAINPSKWYQWRFLTWRRSDHYGADTGRPLQHCIKDLVQQRLGILPNGPVRLVTNMRCMGYGFNPVSIFYCFDGTGTKVEAVVLEVSNTPWLDRRLYVIPGIHYRWEKDFHVSPFMDVFHDYEWTLRVPDNENIRVKAISYRRQPPCPHDPKAKWTQTVGDAPIKPAPANDQPRTFVVGLNLKRIDHDRSWRAVLYQPVMTSIVLLLIHIQAVKVMLFQKCPYKKQPVNSPKAGLLHLIKHLAVFTVATPMYLLNLAADKIHQAISPPPN